MLIAFHFHFDSCRHAFAVFILRHDICAIIMLAEIAGILMIFSPDYGHACAAATFSAADILLSHFYRPPALRLPDAAIH